MQGDGEDKPKGAFPNQKRYLVIIPSPGARGGRRTSKVEKCEVFAVEPATFLRCSEAPITFDRKDHPARAMTGSIPCHGRPHH